MNEERTGKCLRQVKHIRGHLWHRYSITVNQQRRSPSLMWRLACYSHSGKYLHGDHTISLRWEVWAYKTCLIPRLRIAVSLQSQKSELSCICMPRLSIVPVFLWFSIKFWNYADFDIFLFFILLNEMWFLKCWKW